MFVISVIEIVLVVCFLLGVVLGFSLAMIYAETKKFLERKKALKKQ